MSKQYRGGTGRSGFISQEVRDGWIYRNGIKIRPCGQYPETEADRAEYLRQVKNVEARMEKSRIRVLMPCETCGGLPCMEGCR